MGAKSQRTAVVLFNLGGPECLGAVRHFLFNLFSDPAILRIPQPFRLLLAGGISWYRTFEARKIYSTIGGGSPILKNTQAQAGALQDSLGDGYRTFVCMRYWHPRAEAVIQQVQSYAPKRIVLLSLYPQYSTTTIESSIKEWQQKSLGELKGVKTEIIDSYPTLDGFVQRLALSTKQAMQSCGKNYRILFSAHGLPQKIIDQGDPYQLQVEETVGAILSAIGERVDYQICYQSRVGPMRWLAPSTEEEVRRAGRERRAVIMVPVSFVSEHSETLFELDVQYRGVAKESGVPEFIRVPTVGSSPEFVGGLAELVRESVAGIKEARCA